MLNLLLMVSGCVMLLVSLFITLQTRFIQFRALPQLWRLFFGRQETGQEGAISSRSALLTAMSTTIGISTIVGPVIAIRLGGPGALVGFLLAVVLGAATSYAEVSFAVRYRERIGNRYFGGPMQYLSKLFSPGFGKFYALGCSILMLAWSAAQANQVAAIFSSSVMGAWKVPLWASGSILAVGVVAILVGGIRRVAAVSSSLVPIMFVLYLGASFCVIALNWQMIPSLLAVVFKSCFVPQTFSQGVVIGGIVSAFRWGVLKGLQGTEAGVGTQAIPHSSAHVARPTDQGILAMASIYSAGFVILISSLTALISSTWLDPHLQLGIDMVVATFQQTFSVYGGILIAISAFLFGFGTILGNGYNGLECYSFLTKGEQQIPYYCMTGLMVFLGAIGDVQTVWSYVDLVLIAVMVPHALALLQMVRTQKELLAAA